MGIESAKMHKDDFVFFFKMFRFMKPYIFPYVIGFIISCTRYFMFTFMIALSAGNMMEAIISRDADIAIRALIILVSMMLGYLLVLMPGQYIEMIAKAKAIRDMKRELFRAFLSIGIESDSIRHSGEGIAAINNDADIAADVYGPPLGGVLERIISIVASTTVVVAIDWRLGVATIFAGIIGFIIQNRFTGTIGKISKEHLLANADATKKTSNVLTGAITIRAYKMQVNTLTSFNQENAKIMTLRIIRAGINMWQNLFFSVQGWLNIVIVLGLGGWLVSAGQIEFHLLLIALGLCAHIVSCFGSIGITYANLQGPIAGAKRVFAFLESGVKNVSRKNRGLQPQSYKIQIENLSFSYINADRESLVDINLSIDENQFVAVVGDSGSGKSTLLRAIIGLYERENMPIELGGMSYNDVHISDWRKHFAYVDQDCKLFDMSIKDNIAMGNAGKATDTEITLAAKRAGAHDFIKSFNMDYETLCGDIGGNLSGGQKQRIAIARSLIKNTPILVFDEITSALDKNSEDHIMETIESLKGEHTILITTHNIESVTNADMIVVMDNGRIAEIGTHDELNSVDGLYRELNQNHIISQKKLGQSNASHE